MMCGFSSTLEDNSAPEAGLVSIRTSAATGDDDTREARSFAHHSDEQSSERYDCAAE